VIAAGLLGFGVILAVLSLCYLLGRLYVWLWFVPSPGSDPQDAPAVLIGVGLGISCVLALFAGFCVLLGAGVQEIVARW
jgi:hypothetical protein